MLRTRRLFRPAAGAVGLAALFALLALAGVPLPGAPSPAAADPTDGTLTIVVQRDTDASGSYDSGVDNPQPGIEITVRYPGGHTETGVTGDDGRDRGSPGQRRTRRWPVLRGRGHPEQSSRPRPGTRE